MMPSPESNLKSQISNLKFPAREIRAAGHDWLYDEDPLPNFFEIAWSIIIVVLGCLLVAACVGCQHVTMRQTHSEIIDGDTIVREVQIDQTLPFPQKIEVRFTP